MIDINISVNTNRNINIGRYDDDVPIIKMILSAMHYNEISMYI